MLLYLRSTLLGVFNPLVLLLGLSLIFSRSVLVDLFFFAVRFSDSTKADKRSLVVYLVGILRNACSLGKKESGRGAPQHKVGIL